MFPSRSRWTRSPAGWLSCTRQGLIPTLIGTAAGAAGAFGVTRFMEGLLFGISPTDPATFVAICSLLVGVALAASLLPALRAMRVDPQMTLRHE